MTTELGKMFDEVWRGIAQPSNAKPTTKSIGGFWAVNDYIKDGIIVRLGDEGSSKALIVVGTLHVQQDYYNGLKFFRGTEEDLVELHTNYFKTKGT